MMCTMNNGWAASSFDCTVISVTFTKLPSFCASSLQAVLIGVCTHFLPVFINTECCSRAGHGKTCKRTNFWQHRFSFSSSKEISKKLFFYFLVVILFLFKVLSNCQRRKIFNNFLWNEGCGIFYVCLYSRVNWQPCLSLSYCTTYQWISKLPG